jgi:hypothetical protein
MNLGRQGKEGAAMLTYEDCLEFCDLSEDEVAAIAEHEHVPEMVAVEMGNYLVHSDQGGPLIRNIILDDIREARQHGHSERAARLELVLKHFLVMHPQNNRALY